MPAFSFFNDTATTEIYTLSLHDALPISLGRRAPSKPPAPRGRRAPQRRRAADRRNGGRAHPQRAAARGVRGDRQSTRLNSSHSQISYAVLCLKKKKRT